MRVLWVAIRYHHFCQRQAVKDATLLPVVVVGYIVDDNAFAIVEAHVEIPILPGDLTVVDGKRDARGLGDMERFQVWLISSFCLDRCWVVVIWFLFVQGPSYGRNIDMYDLLGVAVEDGDEVKRVGILAIINVRSVVHQALL